MILRIDLDMGTEGFQQADRINEALAFALRAIADTIEGVADLRGVNHSGVNEVGTAFGMTFTDAEQRPTGHAQVLAQGYVPDERYLRDAVRRERLGADGKYHETEPLHVH